MIRPWANKIHCELRDVRFGMAFLVRPPRSHIGKGRPMKRLHSLLTALLMLGLATAARAYDTAPVSDPEALGFSSSRLERIAAWQQAQVDAGAFSGAVAAIARNGRVAYLRAVGFRDRSQTIPPRLMRPSGSPR